MLRLRVQWKLHERALSRALSTTMHFITLLKFVQTVTARTHNILCKVLFDSKQRTSFRNRRRKALHNRMNDRNQLGKSIKKSVQNRK